MARKLSSAARGRHLMHEGKKSEPTKSTVELAREAGMTEAEVQRFKAALAATVFTLKPPEKVYFPDGWVERLPPVKDPMRDAIARVFEHFKLDPEDPQSWAQVVSYFAFVFFLDHRRKRGRPAKHAAEEAKLVEAVRGLPGLSNIRAAQRLVNDEESPFYVEGILPSDGVEGLRKRIGRVRKKVGTKIDQK